jgi:hypothetical protein
VNALSGTGCETVVLLALLDPPPPPPPPDVLVEAVLDRVVPLAEVVALLEMPVDELVAVSGFAVVPADPESAELVFTVAVAVVDLLVLPDDSAEVEFAADDTPFVADAVSSDALAPPAAEPAPDEDPCVLDAVAATVPVVVACT